MKSLYKKLSIVTTMLFIAGILYSAFLLYTLPDALIKVNVIDLITVHQARPILNYAYIFIGISAALGLVTIIFLILADKNSSGENIIHIQSFKERSEKGKINFAIEENEDSSSLQFKKKKAEEIIIKNASDPKIATSKLLSFLCKELEASSAALYITKICNNINVLDLYSSYAFIIPESKTVRFEFGEGLAGQSAKIGKLINIKSIPEGYIKIFSGLGEATPKGLIIIPLIKDNSIIGVVEIASFKEFIKKEEIFLQEIFNHLASNVTIPLEVIEDVERELTIEK
jgi:putative methionine-R-sulfoxide reductase with GAF domain